MRLCNKSLQQLILRACEGSERKRGKHLEGKWLMASNIEETLIVCGHPRRPPSGLPLTDPDCAEEASLNHVERNRPRQREIGLALQ